MTRVRLDRLSLGSSTDDAEQFILAVHRSSVLHGDFVSPPTDRAAFLAMLKSDTQSGNVRFAVKTDNADDDLVGMFNVSSIIRGVFQSAFLGFYAFEPFAGRGLMREGLVLVLNQVFGELGLHRIEANVQPTNGSSIKLVRHCGFREEGFSPRYLRIAGAWRDHLRFALLSDEWSHDDR